MIVFMISCGVALASKGELRFNIIGFVTQAAAVAVCLSPHHFFAESFPRKSVALILGVQFEASRLVMIQILLHGLKMDPLVSLHYYAPVCALINLAILPFTEGLAPFYEIMRIGYGSIRFARLQACF